jgi:hypothetical protein
MPIGPSRGLSTDEEQWAMSDEHDNHGKTPAAWTLVVIVLIGCLVSSIAVLVASTPTFFVGIGIVVLGLVVGKVMQMMAGGGTPVEEKS